MSKIYYGALALPKGKRRPNMVEAAKAKQVRFFGINLIDPKTLQLADADKKKKLEKLKNVAAVFKLHGILSKLKRRLEAAKSKSDKQKIEKEIKDVKAQITKKT